MDLEKNVQLKQPKYQQIAIDLASKIVERKYYIGDKIYARSSLASQYKVSAETARRAIAVLQDLEIVEASKGSGVIIKSYEKAAHFVRQFHDVQSIHEIQNDLLASIHKQQQELINLQEKAKQLISRTEHFRSVNPFIPYQLELSADSPCIHQTVQALNFWQNTASTIVGIRRGNELLISPGPYVSFEEGDVIYFIGNDESFARVQSFLYPNA
ncbi:TrkA C-terminal domain-containing protein [Lysinibacillus sp. FSL H8-0500]|uniref:TrkA C-terminal domain-containing protein n=1 Tax=Lysinibacillus sp. FSL H8-0500 TaxID=2921393 RepID=UPI003101053B